MVALDLPSGPGFVDTLRAVWDAGDAALPIDSRLPRPAVERLLQALRPTRIVTPEGSFPCPDGIPMEPGDALVVATSGTTGEPKGVVHTHASVTASAVATSARLDVDPDRDRWVACLPLAHIGGLSVVTRSLVTGTPCTVLDRFDGDTIESEARRGATLVSLVATALGRCDASGYRAILLGGAAAPTSSPPNVVSTYGMTETGSGCVYDGRPLGGVDLRIDDGTLGAVGEVLVRGPMLLRSYRDGTDPRLAGGWLPTGDGGRIRGDGSLVVFGRMAEVIVTGGEKVWPVPIEAVLATMDQVAEVAVWKRPDPDWGERVVAWMVLRPGAEAPSLEEVRALVGSEVAPYAAPHEMVIVGALPRAPGGKVRRSHLV